MTKTYRVYFNRKSEWPTIWSIDEGAQTSEINVQGFVLEDVRAESHNLPEEQLVSANHLNTPAAWITVTATLHIESGIAYFRPSRYDQL